MLDSFTKLVINNQGNLPVKTEYWALVSGGKDSLFMLFAILKNKLPLDRVVTCDFPLMSPIERRGISFIEDSCHRWGIPFYKYSFDGDIDDLYKKYGKPSFNNRWCTNKLKQEITSKLRCDLFFNGVLTVCYVGYASNEKDRAFRLGLKYGIEKYPLIDFDVSEEYILNYIRSNPQNDIWDGWYNSFDRLGCPSCPFAKKSFLERQWLRDHGYDFIELW